MHSSAFGYVRVSASASEHDLRKALADYAEHAGYTLAEVFTEHEELGSSAFAALMDALKRSKHRLSLCQVCATLPTFPDCAPQLKISLNAKHVLVS